MLWTFALKTTAERHNRLKIDINGVTPNKRFSGIRTTMNLKDEHPWGCPIYVLDHRNQDVSGGMPKWEPCSRIGIYLGRSPFHASSVALVLNPRTGLVSPQYYMAFDNDFSAVPHMISGTVPKNWADLVKRSSECVTEEKINPDDTWFRQDLSADSVASEPQETDLQKLNTEAKGTIHHPSPLSNTQVNEGDTTHRADTTPEDEGGPPSTDNTSANEGDKADQAPINQLDQSELQMPAIIDLATTRIRRSPRNQKVTSKQNFGLFTLFCFGTSQTVKPSTGDQTILLQTISHVENCNSLFD